MTMKSMEKMIVQFASAKGKNEIHINSKEFLLEFGAWLKEYKKASEEYLEILDYYGLKYDNSFCAEVGKNQYDSIVMDYKTKIITQNLSDFKKIESDRLIEGNVIIKKATPILVRPNKEDTEILSQFINTYMIHNPYSPENIKGWDKIHNLGENNIIMGVFGNLNDKDKNSKIEELIQFRDKLIVDSFIEEYETIQDMYCYVIGSKRKILARL